MARRTISVVERAAIVYRYELGAKITQLVADYSRTSHTIYRILKEAGVKLDGYSKRRGTCFRCHVILDDFNRYPSFARLHDYMCKSCMSQKQKDWSAATRRIVIDHYGGKCICCGEKRYEFLTIDHINGGGSAHKRKLNKRSTMFMRWIIKNNFPDIFRLLCYNCNCARGAYGYCPHEKELTLVTAL